jgi:hypothetical protein
MLDQLLILQADIRDLIEPDNRCEYSDTVDDVARFACHDIENACTDFADRIIEILNAATSATAINAAEESRAEAVADRIDLFSREFAQTLTRAGGTACITCAYGRMCETSAICVKEAKTTYPPFLHSCEAWVLRR